MVASGFPVNAHVGVVLVVVVGEGVDSVLMTLNVVLFVGTCATSFFSLGGGGGGKSKLHFARPPPPPRRPQHMS